MIGKRIQPDDLKRVLSTLVEQQKELALLVLDVIVGVDGAEGMIERIQMHQERSSLLLSEIIAL